MSIYPILTNVCTDPDLIKNLAKSRVKKDYPITLDLLNNSILSDKYVFLYNIYNEFPNNQKYTINVQNSKLNRAKSTDMFSGQLNNCYYYYEFNGLIYESLSSPSGVFMIEKKHKLDFLYLCRKRKYHLAFNYLLYYGCTTYLGNDLHFSYEIIELEDLRNSLITNAEIGHIKYPKFTSIVDELDYLNNGIYDTLTLKKEEVEEEIKT